MIIQIESRESVELRAKQPFPPHTALITITNIDYDFAKLENKPWQTLRLQFDDVSSDLFTDVLGRKPTADEFKKLAKKYHMFNYEQATEVAEFVEHIQNNGAEVLVCQCEYGQSRSAGIAAAVRQWLYSDAIEIFTDDRYYPNKAVYRMTLTAIQQREYNLF